MTGYMEMAKCKRKQRLLGKSIRRIRVRRNMTQRELANRRTVSVQLHPGWPVATTGNMPMTDSEWLHYRDLKSRCPACKRPAHIAKRDGDFYFVDDEYNPFVRHAPVKTTEAVFRFFANGYRREHGTEPEVTGNRKLSERDILSGMGAVPTKTDLGKR